MSALKPDIMVNPQELYSQVSNVSTTAPYVTQLPPVGTRAVTGDGREYRLIQAGATNLIGGQILQCAAPQSNLQAITGVATVVGQTTITLTISTGTAITAGQFSGGEFITYGSVANGGGQNLQISTNSAVTASGTSITIQLTDPIQVATTTSGFVDIWPPMYTGIIQCPSTLTSKIVGLGLGVNNNASTATTNGLTALYYGWVQVKGFANALISGTPAIGTGLSAPNSGTAGALQVTAATLMDIATNLATGVNGQYGPVDLLIS